MGRRIPEYEVIEDTDGYRKGWSIVDEYGDLAWDTRHILFDSKAEAIREAERMHHEDVENYDGPDNSLDPAYDGPWSGGICDNN